MRLVHFSDWHWAFGNLPEADLYVCSGDMLPNFPTLVNEEVSQPFVPPTKYMSISAAHERKMQPQAVNNFVVKKGFRDLLGSPDAPIVALRGNHDFMDLKPLFGGCNFLHELVDNELIEVCGLRITGHRGIPWIFGTWNDEMSRPDLLDKARNMPVADVYVTHYPPTVLDGVGVHRYGLDGLLNELIYRADPVDFGAAPPTLHLFGHIHECGGLTHNGGGVLFSNAAMTYNVLEGNQRDGWKDVTPP